MGVSVKRFTRKCTLAFLILGAAGLAGCGNSGSRTVSAEAFLAPVATDDGSRAATEVLVVEEDFLVAEGRAPVEGKDEEFTLDEAYAHREQDWLLDAPVNYYKFSAIVTVEAETVIGRIPPLVPSESGIDVLGNEIRPLREPQPMELDATV